MGEEPSTASRGIADQQEAKKMAPSTWEKPKLPMLARREVEAEILASTKLKAKRKGPKGPNPLSCRKRKKHEAENPMPQKEQEPRRAPKRVRSRRMGMRNQAKLETPVASGSEVV